MRKSYSINADDSSLRIDRWFRINISKVPQGLIEKFLRIGKIKVNNKKAKSSYKLKINDVVNIYDIKITNKPKKKLFVPSKKILSNNEKNIIFNNENYLVLNKKPGMPVQGGTKSKKNLVDIMGKSKLFSYSRPYIVHRLDKDTSGVLIIAKNRKTAQFFTSLFRLRRIHKSYISLCYGEVNKKNGIIKYDLERHENKKKIIEKAVTKYKVLDSNYKFSLVLMNPITGRKHQLRKHMLMLGHPIVGDNKYYLFKNKSNNLMLHAFEIMFMVNNEKFNYKASLPDYFIEFFKSNKINFPNFLKNC